MEIILFLPFTKSVKSHLYKVVHLPIILLYPFSFCEQDLILRFSSNAVYLLCGCFL